MKHPEILVAIVGGVLFAVGLWGTVTSSASARAASEGFALDCIFYTPEPDCAQRAATINMYNAQTAMYESMGATGFAIIIVAALLNMVLGRRQKNAAEAPPSRP